MPELLRVGVLPDRTLEQLRQRFEPLLKHLSSELGVRREPTLPDSRSDLRHRFREDTLGFALMPGNAEHAEILSALGADHYVPARLEDFRNLSEIVLAQESEGEGSMP